MNQQWENTLMLKAEVLNGKWLSLENARVWIRQTDIDWLINLFALINECEYAPPFLSQFQSMLLYLNCKLINFLVYFIDFFKVTACSSHIQQVFKETTVYVQY